MSGADTFVSSGVRRTTIRGVPAKGWALNGEMRKGKGFRFFFDKQMFVYL